jgi:TonB family protein
MRSFVLALCVSSGVLLAQTAPIQPIEDTAPPPRRAAGPATSPVVLHKATPDTVFITQKTLDDLALSEPAIAAPPDTPDGTIVVMKVLVSKTGDVEELATSLGDGTLRQAVQNGVMRWKFRPYLVNGEPREFESLLVVRFSAGVGTKWGPREFPPLGGGIMGGMSLGGPSQPPQTAAPGEAGPMNVSSAVVRALLLAAIPPLYPRAARAAHVQGVVILKAIVSKEGQINDLQVISGPPMLVGAAVDAVRRWRYKPFLLNGAPTEVETTINVNFTFDPPAAPSMPATESPVPTPPEPTSAPN